MDSIDFIKLLTNSFFLIDTEKDKSEPEILQDTVIRMGGDEFTILTDSFKDENDLIKIAERILKSIKSIVFINNMDLNIGISIGIAYTENPVTKEIIFKAADDALYRSKEKGKNTYTIVKI